MLPGKFKTEYIIIFCIIALNIFLHILADLNSGFHGDELLYIESGRHLAAGYMDFSPMIAILAFIQNIFNSSSIFVNHIFLHIATALIILLSGLITIELGGKRIAVLTTLLCITFAPGFAVSHSLFLPDVFDQLAWISCLYFILKFCQEPNNRNLILIGIIAALGFLTKYTIAFLIGGLILSILVFNFSFLKRRALWVSAVIALIIISPNKSGK
jgi:4-amino-4-deoxy-L-arabinose transferase-like glycosyltransferase